MIDTDIINAVLSGKDKNVIDSLYKDVFPNVKRYIKKNSGNKEEAEDCFQEAMMKFYRQVLKGEFNTKYKVHGYIYSLSIRLWLNNIKKDKPKVSLEHVDVNLLQLEVTPDNTELFEGDNDVVLEILLKLGEKCKNLLYHAVYSDLINEDLMHRYGYNSIAAVKMQHKRCKQKMIQLLESFPELETALRSLVK